ncbi:TIGR03985 family CRISPR-associated protein [Leptolyngbya sp. O-77]|uniref:TIGR03985 family CRISPR-associated protein n=1 Tax=Leptolyngbya sp. O-77 TaxID=1080068 RepID=UPI00074D36EE|nr:TIGR03985 family CRISPR-associated protein [Leptolyngbya sp. O-77]BAU44930.1 hypothetical protein O77CONTIG1_04776 [Leptolyngbya sp. O-77]
MRSFKFPYPPTPAVLHWLSGGQLANRLGRSLRLWLLLDRLYSNPALQQALPQPFRYQQLCRLLYAPSHSWAETVSRQQITAYCQGTDCLCQQTASQLIFSHPNATAMQISPQAWGEAICHMTGLTASALEEELEKCPFAVTHRSLRADLDYLTQAQWLQLADSQMGTKRYLRIPPEQWPIPPADPVLRTPGLLSRRDGWTLLRALESIAFVQPQLEVIINQLWDALTERSPQGQPSPFPTREPTRRIFIHLDYILNETVQERVDSYQAELEALWQTPDGGVVQFDYWLARQEQQVRVTVYPVCLHYARRAKYLSAYGVDPQGNFGWHNYRLDRIVSPQLQVLPWGDLAVPEALKALRHAGQLPTPAAVEQALEAAWGFNFYLPKALLIMRFSPAFARWYVDETDRHPTFHPLPHRALPRLIRLQMADTAEQAALLDLVARLPKGDRYYCGWIRLGDINVTMRLRDWRPNGEVIAPLALRQQMLQEALQEVHWYQAHQDSAENRSAKTQVNPS